MTIQETRLEALHLAIYLDRAAGVDLEEATKRLAAFIGEGEKAALRLGCLKAAIRKRSGTMKVNKAIMRAEEFMAFVDPLELSKPPKPVERPRRGKRKSSFGQPR
jgi:hypothetical protein